MTGKNGGPTVVHIVAALVQTLRMELIMDSGL